MEKIERISRNFKFGEMTVLIEIYVVRTPGNVISLRLHVLYIRISSWAGSSTVL